MSIPFLKKNDNRGASLVLVIVALLFVGIISVLILTLTVGNAKTVDTVSRSSENFYTTENFVDDLKIYLQKFANQAATQAYADQLQSISVTGSINEAQFQTRYRQILSEILEAKWADISDSANNVSKITFGAHDASSGITFTIGSFDTSYDPDTGTIKGIQVGYKNDSNEYKTEITTDLVFSANMPSLSWRSADKSFDYDVDKYVIIGNGNVHFGNNEVGDTYTFAGDIKGSLYAKNNLKFNLSANSSIYAKIILTGGNFDVYNKKLAIHGFDKNLLDLEKTTYTAKSQYNEDVWASNMNVYSSVTVDNAQIYLEDDLSLDGDGSSFKVEGNDASIIAYSSDPTSTGSVSNHRNSGAIIINGTGAELDLSKLKTLILAGTAYTEVPSVAGDTSTTNAKKYFVQGESITFRSLQSMYLVDASKLWYLDSGKTVHIGSNPMTESEFNKWRTGNGSYTPTNTANLYDGAYNYDSDAVPTGVNLASNCAFDIKAVQYVDNGAKYYYVYWNFAEAEDAVNFFKALYTTTDPVLKQKLDLLNGGKIILPTGGTKKTKGNIVNKNGNAFGYTTNTALGAGDITTCSDSKQQYGFLKKSLSKEEKLVGADLFADGLFAGGKLTTAQTGRFMELDFPSDWVAGNMSYSDGTCIKGTGASAENDSTTYKYYLVTGSQITIGSGDEEPTPSGNIVAFTPKDNAKYIVVSSGDVIINAAGKDFKGIIFANGDVSVKAADSLNCLGNYMQSRKENGGSAEIRYLSEFDALLQISIHDTDPNHANSILRTLFDVRNAGSGSSTSEPEKDIADVNSDNWIEVG